MIPKAASCTVIIITHNSEKTIHKTIESLAKQTSLPEKIIIVDTGSKSTDYLSRYRSIKNIELLYANKEIGFCCGNNLGMQRVPSHIQYIFLLNPDAFLTSSYIEQAIAFMENPAHVNCGALSGALLGYDIENDRPNETYDSTGIFRTWYGKWVDRDQGKKWVHSVRTSHENVPALCGAAFFCRKKAVDQVLIRGIELFDAAFYMYKEDIDLSLRLTRAGWCLAFLPWLQLYHCRGWNRNRAEVPRQLRLCSAKNEVRIQWRSKQPIPVIYSCLKYVAVKLMDL